MALTVLSIAFPFAPVGPSAVGGSEQILSNLDSALTAAGCVSLVVACEGSEPAGQLFSVPLKNGTVLTDADRHWCRNQFQAAIDRALRSRPVDLIHMHGMDFDQYTLPPDIPVLVTLHMPIDWYRRDIWSQLAGRVQFQCVSGAQRRSGPELFRDVPVVENGVALPHFSPDAPRADHALALGRICPEKNVHAALQAGTLADTRVLLGGQVFPYREHMVYFSEKVEPLLHGGPSARPGPCHEFLGPLSPAKRHKLLAEARCLLHPTLAPETSSLVAMEALAAGTPVIAYPSGALPSIIEHGVTGFLVHDVEEMAAAIREVHTLSPQACRAAAERRFSADRMVRDYFELYTALVAGRLREKVYA